MNRQPCWGWFAKQNATSKRRSCGRAKVAWLVELNIDAVSSFSKRTPITLNGGHAI